MTLPEFLAWCHHGEGSYWLPRLMVKWQIEDAAERARYADQADAAREAQLTRDGWRGGRCDPADSCTFEDEGADAA